MPETESIGEVFRVSLPAHTITMSIGVDFKGTALVTGAAQGIGRAIALRLAQDGFNIALNDLVSKAEQLEALRAEVIRSHERNAVVVCADVSVEKEVECMVEATAAALGRLDVMVANAGICEARASLLDVNEAEWDALFGVNVRGTFLCYKYAAKQMILQGHGGRIIGACSGASKQVYGILLDNSASKFAVRDFTRAAALEFGKHGITVNAYAPDGTVHTSMTQGIAEITGFEEQAFLELNANQIPMRTNVTTTDITSLVSFLASKEAEFITGQSISADSGPYFD